MTTDWFACSVQAAIVRVVPARESPLYAVVEIRLSNDSTLPCNVQSYRVRWPGGEAGYDPHDLIVPAHTTVSRTVRINPDAGDIGALLRAPHSAAVDIVRTAKA
jgi:hypothetical protein